MSAQTSRPRNPLGLAVIGLLLGSGAMMMWFGRGRAALTYTLASVAILLGFFVIASLGAIPTWPFTPFGTRWTIELVRLPVLAVAFVHAFRVRATALERPWYSRWYVALPLIPVAATVAALGVRTFLFHPYNVPAGSMIPNMMVGDYFLVDKRAYGYGPYSLPGGLAPSHGRSSQSRPERGDIVVFRLPSDPTIDYIKRVVGLPGDRIRMVDGVLTINDVPVRLEAVTLPAYFYETDEFGGPLTFFRETLPNGRSYVVANSAEDGPADNTEAFVVPEGHYFMMGDNRDNSVDSRYPDMVGYVPEENLIGRAAWRFWNEYGVPLTERPEETLPQE